MYSLPAVGNLLANFCFGLAFLMPLIFTFCQLRRSPQHCSKESFPPVGCMTGFACRTVRLPAIRQPLFQPTVWFWIKLLLLWCGGGCGPGLVSAQSSSSCPVGSFFNATVTQCVTCPGGVFCVGGVNPALSCPSGILSCLPNTDASSGQWGQCRQSYCGGGISLSCGRRSVLSGQLILPHRVPLRVVLRRFVVGSDGLPIDCATVECGSYCSWRVSRLWCVFSVLSVLYTGCSDAKSRFGLSYFCS